MADMHLECIGARNLVLNEFESWHAAVVSDKLPRELLQRIDDGSAELERDWNRTATRIAETGSDSEQAQDEVHSLNTDLIHRMMELACDTLVGNVWPGMQAHFGMKAKVEAEAFWTASVQSLSRCRGERRASDLWKAILHCKRMWGYKQREHEWRRKARDIYHLSISEVWLP